MATALALLGGAAFAVTSYDRPPPEAAALTGEVVKPPPGTDTASATPAPAPTLSPGTTSSPRVTVAGNSTASWMAQLVYDAPGYGKHFVCAGTLVAPNKVLTAAHCLDDPRTGARQDWERRGEVAVGTNRSVTTPNAARRVDVTRAWVHPRYDARTFTHDIALLTLSRPVAHTTLELAGPADTALYEAGTDAVTYGWGLTASREDTARIAPVLQKVTLPLNADPVCRVNLGTGFRAADGMFCAGQLGTGDDVTGLTSCPADSGGPLVTGNKVVGVVSWGMSRGEQVCHVSGTHEVFGKVSGYQPRLRAQIDDTDLGRDGRADLFARTRTGGGGYVHASAGHRFAAPVPVPGAWDAYDVVLQSDLDRDGLQDFVMRRTADGAVLWRRQDTPGGAWRDTRIAGDWSAHRFLVVPGDVTGDRFPDLLTVTASGTLYIHQGNGDGSLARPVAAGGGYQVYNSLRGHGDFTGDGRTDLFARTKDGKLYLLEGQGSVTHPFAVPRHVRDWVEYNGFAAPGDVTGDGKADYLARSRAGNLYLYPGTGKASRDIFAPRIRVGGGYQRYDLLG
ncbi:trypsin-like serine protease [Streptomyces uncialis]|uniref:trypsin-like serine protease n=1 Tax=Streptomyces uncialis TaxID=1048205 RepID=UPI0033E8848D